jgi:predicted negative regulator of RcsB-dependent stress response
MKSERRHELQHNALLDWLMKTGETIKPQLNAILLGLVVVVLGVIGYRWMSAQSADKEATAWDSVFLAMGQGDTAQLDQAVEDYPRTTAAQWAAVVSGDLQLSAGCQDLFTTKATAADQFQKAQDKYKLVLENCREPVIRERATYGLARTYEAMAGTRQSQTDLDGAREKYQEVVDKWPNGAYAKAAQSRLNALSQTSTMEFYEALAAWEPRPAITSPEGLDGLNIPFDQSGGGLDVGEKPKSYFGDITDKIDETMEAPAEGEPAGDAAPAADSAEPPAMPEATGDKPAAEEGSE